MVRLTSMTAACHWVDTSNSSNSYRTDINSINHLTTYQRLRLTVQVSYCSTRPRQHLTSISQSLIKYAHHAIEGGVEKNLEFLRPWHKQGLYNHVTIMQYHYCILIGFDILSSPPRPFVVAFHIMASKIRDQILRLKEHIGGFVSLTWPDWRCQVRFLSSITTSFLPFKKKIFRNRKYRRKFLYYFCGEGRRGVGPILHCMHAYATRLKMMNINDFRKEIQPKSCIYILLLLKTSKSNVWILKYITHFNHKGRTFFHWETKIVLLTFILKSKRQPTSSVA